MNKLEKLMAQYPNIEFIYSEAMPDYFKGLCVGDVIFINSKSNKTLAEKVVTLSEEIAHYETGVGNIIKQETVSDQKQEYKARQKGNQRLLSLDDLIHCWESGHTHPYEIAAELDVTTECIQHAVESYRYKNGLAFSYKNYHISFNNDMNIIINKI